MTPGWFDLRPVTDRLPWPDLTGKRCLDVGTYDGFWAFEMERRGAREVIATDLDDHSRWDWPDDWRLRGVDWMDDYVGEEKGRGFRLAKEALGSSVERVPLSVYDLSPEELGEFDFVFCGSLLLHLRDPVGALEAVRRVCTGQLLSAEAINLRLSLLHPRLPAARFSEPFQLLQWWEPNRAAHRSWIEASRFTIERATRAYCVPLGASHPPPGRSPRALATSLVKRVFTGGDGVPHAAVLARPR